jgi:L-lactate dehydrogenase (cytochrome)
MYDSFDWVSAVKWLRTLTTLPIIIKGIQTWEDAKLCMENDVHAYLSNHDGQQLNSAPSALETLLEIREDDPEVLEKCDVIVDGGFRRGTDVVKALCLGAKAVGLGRPFLYSLVWGKRV